MNRKLSWIMTFLLVGAALAQTSAPKKKSQSRTPAIPPALSKEFILAAEAALDEADQIDTLAPEAVYSRHMDAATSAQAALGRMADTDEERSVVKYLSMVIFEIDTCRIAGTSLMTDDYGKCLSRMEDHRMQVMIHLGRHKQSGSWVDGPPPPESAPPMPATKIIAVPE